jgi:hypothetical protein
LRARGAIHTGDALRTLRTNTGRACSTSRTLRTGRTRGTWRTGGAGGTGVAGDARGLAAEEGEEIESIVGRNARGDRCRKRAGEIVTKDDDFVARNANTTDRGTIDDLAHVGDVTHDRTARAVRFGDDANGLVATSERRNN